MSKIYLRLIIGADYEPIELFEHKMQFIKSLPNVEVLALLNYQSIENKNYYLETLKNHGIDAIFLWKGQFSEIEKVKRMEGMIKKLCRNEWIMNSDLDEFPDFLKPPRDFLKELSLSNANLVMGGIIDRFSKDYDIKKKINKTTSLFKQFPVNVNMHKLFPESKQCINIEGVNECLQPKVVLHKKHIKVSHGYHIPIGNFIEFRKRIPVYHFKWFDGVLMKLQSEINDVPDAKKHLHKNYFDQNKNLDKLKINLNLQNHI